MVITASGGQITFDTATGAITGYTGSPTEVVIPSVINGVSVTSIGGYAFYSCNSLTSIIISDGVTSIDSYAFASCRYLASVSIPESVTSIGSYAFTSCLSSLTSISIPSRVTSIGEGAFYNCSNLVEAKFYGNTPTIIGAPNIFNSTKEGFTVYYLEGKVDFTSPWLGYYPTEMFTP